MLVSSLFLFFAFTLPLSEVKGVHFLSNLCTETKLGTYAYPGVDNVYFECEYGNATVYACPSNTNFDPIFTTCSTRKIPYERRKCFNNGERYPHPFDCTKYIVCYLSKYEFYSCQKQMVYNIEGGMCLNRHLGSSCNRESANNLRADLNLKIYSSMNEIMTNNKRDTKHELKDLDEEADIDIDEKPEELNVASLQSDNPLDELIHENEISDDSLLETQLDSSDQVTINISDNYQYHNISSKQNYNETANENDRLTTFDMNLLRIILGAPFNIAIKTSNQNSTYEKESEFLKLAFELLFLTSIIPKNNESSFENASGSIKKNTSDANSNVFESALNDSVINSSVGRQFPDDVKMVFSEDIETSTLASSVANIILNETIDTVFSTSPMIEITNKTTVFEQYSDVSISPSTPFMSTSEKAETTLRYSDNDETTAKVDSTVSQRINTLSLNSTSNDIPDTSNIHSNASTPTDIENAVITTVVTDMYTLTSTESSETSSTWAIEKNHSLINSSNYDHDVDDYKVDFSSKEIENTTVSSLQPEKESLSSSIESKSLDSEIDIVEEIQSNSTSIPEVTNAEFNHSKVEAVTPLFVFTFNTESTELKGDDINEDTESTLVSTQSVEVTSPVDVSEKMEKIVDESTLREDITEVEVSTARLFIPNSTPEATEIEAGDISNVTAQNIILLLNPTTTESVVQNIVTSTESHETDSTSVKPEYVSKTNSEINDENLGSNEDTESTLVSTQSVEVTSPVEVSEKMEKIIDESTLREDITEVEVSTARLFIPNSTPEATEIEAGDISNVTAQNIILLLNPTTTESVVQHIVTSTESHETDSTSVIPEYVSKTNSEINDENLGSNEDIAATNSEINDENLGSNEDITATDINKIFSTSTPDSLIYYQSNKRNKRLVPMPRQRLRLSGMTQAHHGFVEVEGENDTWKGVCQSTEWTIAEADIICEELGYQRGAQIAWKGSVEEVTTPTWIATVSIKCHGNEEWVDRCQFQDETDCDIQHNAVGVECLLNDETNGV